MCGNSAKDSFGALSILETKAGPVHYYRLNKLAEDGIADVSRLPFSIKVLLEAVLRSENGREVMKRDVVNLAKYDPASPQPITIPFRPARVLMQDFTGVPALVDLAALRSALHRLGGDPARINPQIPVDLIVDHSVQVDEFGSPDALAYNAAREFERNRERYEFLRWGQKSFRNLRIVPPASGICHQVNLEHLGRVVQVQRYEGVELAFPDSLVGTDSHTPMINGLGIVGWGVGGIEAEAVMLGQPFFMPAPEVIGFKLIGRLPEGTTATDLVLTITELLRKKGVVGKFVEFYGAGLSTMSVPDRATISNMAPEYGATIGYFPVDEQTLQYLRQTGRGDLVDLVERYCRAQGIFRTDDTPDPVFADTIELDLDAIRPSLAGPKRPQDRVDLSAMKENWRHILSAPIDRGGFDVLPTTRAQDDGYSPEPDDKSTSSTMHTESSEYAAAEVTHGSVVIAAITSCTNTSNPAVMLAAGLLAKKAVAVGLTVKPYVKTSLAPGSKVVTTYLDQAGLTPYLNQLGFHTVGYGCTTCIGNSGPLPGSIAETIEEKSLVAVAVLSGNRNFEGRINPHVRASFLTSPPLVVAYAIAGTVDIDLITEPLGLGSDGRPVYLKDIWPSDEEIDRCIDKAYDPAKFAQAYDGIDESNTEWNDLPVPEADVYVWREQSTYIQEPPFFVGMSPDAESIRPIENARVLAMLGDSVTTDHISPAGAIDPKSPAGLYLIERGVDATDFNSYGSRRGNDKVMTRGTFANTRIRNLLAPDSPGGWTIHLPGGEAMTIYDASLRYKADGVPVIILAGTDYGMGSSRDWAAKGTYLLGVKAVLAVSFERIHRANLVGMGVLPLQYKPGQNADSLALTGRERYTIHIDDMLRPGDDVTIDIERDDGTRHTITVVCRVDTDVEMDYVRNGGILHAVLRRFLVTQSAQ